MSGKFITFEGGEGGGKSTQVEMLVQALGRAGIRAIRTREPGGAPSAEDIRALLVSGAVDRWSPMAEVLLNYAAREMHVRQTVLPALDRDSCSRRAERSRDVVPQILDVFEPDRQAHHVRRDTGLAQFLVIQLAVRG